MSSTDQVPPEAAQSPSSDYAASSYGYASSDAPMHSTTVTPLHRWALNASDTQFNAVAGAVGGFTSGVVTCPLDVIKTKLQAQGGYAALNKGRHVGHPKLYNGLVGSAKVIWREEGIRGLYRGLGPIVMGYLPTWAVWFTVYNKSKGYISQHSGKCAWSNGEGGILTLFSPNRQQSHSQLLVVYRSRRQQYNRHQPNMGHQNSAHVTEQYPPQHTRPPLYILPESCGHTNSTANTARLALPINARCSSQDVHFRRSHFILFRLNTSTPRFNTCCCAVPDLRVLEDQVYRSRNGRIE